MKLYERLGFLRSKRLHRYYLNGNSAYRLVLYLREGVGLIPTDGVGGGGSGGSGEWGYGEGEEEEEEEEGEGDDGEGGYGGGGGEEVVRRGEVQTV